jgi:endonuclease-3
MQDDETARVATIVERLHRAYPDATCTLHFSNPLELLVATILSAQCTDERVNEVTARLFTTYRSAADYANTPPEELEAAIKPTGFYRTKARYIQAACRIIAERHSGEVPGQMEQLIALPGVARKTGNVVLGNAYGVVEGVVVDTHVGRVARRLGLTASDDPLTVEADLMARLPRTHWLSFAHQVIAHGRALCKAQRPLCPACPLNDLCPASTVAAVSAS